jgi:hypothetical protein
MIGGPFEPILDFLTKDRKKGDPTAIMAKGPFAFQADQKDRAQNHIIRDKPYGLINRNNAFGIIEEIDYLISTC